MNDVEFTESWTVDVRTEIQVDDYVLGSKKTSEAWYEKCIPGHLSNGHFTLCS